MRLVDVERGRRRGVPRPVERLLRVAHILLPRLPLLVANRRVNGSRAAKSGRVQRGARVGGATMQRGGATFSVVLVVRVKTDDDRERTLMGYPALMEVDPLRGAEPRVR